MNATINRYAHCTLLPNNDGKLHFSQLGEEHADEILGSRSYLEPTGTHMLAKAVYNRIVTDFNRGKAIGLSVITYSDAPPGSGLGSSSTLIVAMLRAYSELLMVRLSEYETAALAYQIERDDLGQKGGHQDHYSAAFGGINFMEFHPDHQVLVNPLRVKDWIVSELEASTLLYYSSISRFSSEIISEQIRSVSEQNEQSINATNQLKYDVLEMKDSLLKGRILQVADVLGRTWEAKKQLAKSITNDSLDSIISAAKDAGAYACKVSGAGGGGFIMIMTDPLNRKKIEAALTELPGHFVPFQFSRNGAYAWSVNRGTEGAI